MATLDVSTDHLVLDDPEAIHQGSIAVTIYGVYQNAVYVSHAFNISINGSINIVLNNPSWGNVRAYVVSAYDQNNDTWTIRVALDAGDVQAMLGSL